MGGIEFLVRCNYDTNCLNWIPRFYKQILNYYKEITKRYEGESIIWNNRYILIEGKSIFWKDWFDNGIVHIHDLMNTNGTWMSFDQFSNKYNVRTNFLKYLGILSAVKHAIKFINVDILTKPDLDIQSREFKLNSGRLLNIKKAKSKDFYIEFIEDNLEAPTALLKWNINLNFDEDIFYKSLPLVKKCTREPKLLAVQFKIIHNITNCKSNLFKWRISENDTCDFCTSNQRDDLIHALCKCNHTKQFF